MTKVTTFEGSEQTAVFVGDVRLTDDDLEALEAHSRSGGVKIRGTSRRLSRLGLLSAHGGADGSMVQYRVTKLGYDALAARPRERGRPPTERGRTSPRVQVRLSASEAEQLERDAAQAGTTGAELLRQTYFRR